MEHEILRGGQDSIRAQLEALDTSAISDALDVLGIAGAALGLHSMSGKSRVAGPVKTLALEPVGAALPERHLGSAVIDSSSRGDIVVVEHNGRMAVAGWGGLLTVAAQRRGIAGIIVDGAARDIDQNRETQIPFFEKCAVPRTA